MTRRRPKPHPIAEINVVPYIDVMLVLLIIFMITAPLLNQGINVELPQSSTNNLQSKNKEPLIVSIDAQGNYYLNLAKNPSQAVDTPTLLKLVTTELKSSTRGDQRQVFVKGDQHIDYGTVVKLMNLLQQSGASNIGLITTQLNIAR